MLKKLSNLSAIICTNFFLKYKNVIKSVSYFLKAPPNLNPSHPCATRPGSLGNFSYLFIFTCLSMIIHEELDLQYNN